MPEIFLSWGFWFAVGAAIVVIAATVVIAILLVARGIEREAARALAAAREVETVTQPLWALAGALAKLETVLHRAVAIAGKTGMLADAVESAGSDAERRAAR